MLMSFGKPSAYSLLLAAGLIGRGELFGYRSGRNPGLDAPAGSFVPPARPKKKDLIRAKRGKRK